MENPNPLLHERHRNHRHEIVNCTRTQASDPCELKGNRSTLPNKKSSTDNTRETTSPGRRRITKFTTSRIGTQNRSSTTRIANTRVCRAMPSKRGRGSKAGVLPFPREKTKVDPSAVASKIGACSRHGTTDLTLSWRRPSRFRLGIEALTDALTRTRDRPRPKRDPESLTLHHAATIQHRATDSKNAYKEEKKHGEKLEEEQVPNEVPVGQGERTAL